MPNIYGQGDYLQTPDYYTKLKKSGGVEDETGLDPTVYFVV
jgi:hypothetical protein